MNVYNRDNIQKLLKKQYYTVTPKGNISYAKADRLFGFYKNLLTYGYLETQSEMDRKTFWRYEKDLLAVGLTKAQLQKIGYGHKLVELPPLQH